MATEPMLAPRPVWIWGLPFAPLSRSAAAEAVAALIEAGRPSFFITANTHYAMLSHRSPELREVNDRAAFLLADGAPIVWASRWRGQALPERVAGSDLIHDLCARAAVRGHRLFLLGGAPGVADEAARRLLERHPGLNIVGTHAPPFRELSESEQHDLHQRIRAAAPHLLLIASTMPRGEIWLAEQVERLGVPVGVNVGAAFDFVAGRIPRAPLWLQRVGLEWAYRLSREPRRLAPRYAKNGWFLLRMAGRDFLGTIWRRLAAPAVPAGPSPEVEPRRPIGPDSPLSQP